MDAWDKSEGMKLVKLYRAFALEIEIKRDCAHGVELRRNVERKVKQEDGTFIKERHDRVFVHSKRDSFVPIDAALLLIDADASLEINKLLFGDSLKEEVIRVRRNAYVMQVWSRGFDKRNVSFGNDSKRLLRLIQELIVRERVGGKEVLVVTNRSVRLLITGEKDNDSLPKFGLCWGANVAHFGNIRGEDGWKDFDTVIVIGRNQPPLSSVEGDARALWATALQPLNLLVAGSEDEGGARWVRQPRGYTMADGSRAGVDIDMHPDSRVQLVLELQRECETVQAVDRLRLVHRTEPARVLLLCKLPVDVVVDEIVDWKTMHKMGEPTMLDRLLAGGACAVEPWDAMAAGSAGVFKNGELARWTFRQLVSPEETALEYIMRFTPDLARASFRWNREGKRAVNGTLLHKSHVDPAVWLDQCLPGAIVKVTATISATIPAFVMVATGIVGASMAATMGEFKSEGFGAVGVNGAFVILIAGFESTASAAVGAAGAVAARIGSFTAMNTNSSHRPSGGPDGGIQVGAFTSAASAKLESTTRTMVIDGVTVWITADGRRWFREPPVGAAEPPRRIVRDRGVPSAAEVGQMLRPGGAAPWSGLSVGGRAVESVGWRLTA